VQDSASTSAAERFDRLRAEHLRPRAERPASPTRGVHHVALICSDVERAIRFYQDVLGFPLIEVMENRDYRGSAHIFFDLGHNNLLAFFDFPGLGLQPGIEAIGGLQHMAISVSEDQFAALRRRLEQHGVPYLGPGPGMERSVYFKDPDGIQIELLAEPLLQMDGAPLGE
jgi:glyoxylase I family protein